MGGHNILLPLQQCKVRENCQWLCHANGKRSGQNKKG